jgi:Zn-dependent M28 family amino/carboxypeptidase
MSSPPGLASLADKLRHHVETLARTPRPPGSAEHQAAADYIRVQLRQSGFIVEDVSFQEAGYPGLNLLTRPVPDRADLPLVIIGAHYDSVAGSPGADDNASAVAALLELASAIGPSPALGNPTSARLQLAAYDLEESGLLGSYRHSRELRQAGAAIHGMVSLEMLAYTDHRPGSQHLPPFLTHLYPDVANFIGIVGNVASRDFLQVVTEAMKSVPGLPVEFMAIPGNGEILYQTRLSDHASFWDNGFPALMITDTSFFRNPHYHQASDTPQTLDYPFLAQVTLGVCAAVRRLLQIPTPAGAQ